MTVQQTSRDAYRSEVEPTLGERQAAVLGVLKESPAALTNTEIATRLRWSINRVTPRTNELVKAGRVELAMRRPCSITGRTAIAWRVKGDGTLGL